MAKNNSKNKSYTKEFKDSVLRRLEQNETVGSLSEELDISKSTIYQWVRTHNKDKKVVVTFESFCNGMKTLVINEDFRKDIGKRFQTIGITIQIWGR